MPCRDALRRGPAKNALNRSGVSADGEYVGKVVIGVVAALLLGTASCYQLDVEDSPVAALVVPAPMTPTPEYVSAIGTPAAVTIPDAAYDTWFASKTDPEAGPYDTTAWQEVAAFQSAAATDPGWAEACREINSAAGSDRAAEPLIGALGCSDDPSVTVIQRFALLVLGARAHTALWMRGVPGFNTASIEARLGQVRNACNGDVAGRDAAGGSPFAQACTLAGDASYREGDGSGTFEALGQAYALLAAEIARRDPTVDSEAAFFGAATTP